LGQGVDFSWSIMSFLDNSNTDAYCWDCLSCTSVLYCIDGNFGDIYPSSSIPIKLRSYLKEKSRYRKLKDNIGDFANCAVRKQVWDRMMVKIINPWKPEEADKAQLTRLITFFLTWLLGWFFWEAIWIINSPRGLYFATAYIVLAPPARITIGLRLLLAFTLADSLRLDFKPTPEEFPNASQTVIFNPSAVDWYANETFLDNWCCWIKEYADE